MNFDARTEWPGLISPAADQGKCSSCYAFAVALMLSDRIRISSKVGTSTKLIDPDTKTTSEVDVVVSRSSLPPLWRDNISASYMIDCKECDINRPELCNFSCSKPSPVSHALRFFILKGSPACSVYEETDFTCGGHYLYKAKSAKMIKFPGHERMMREIADHGPIVVSFEVWSNFAEEKFDRYLLDVKGKKLFDHAITLVGWKTEGGQRLWICRNSYGRKFQEDGYFYVPLGSNFCGVEEIMYAIYPYKVYPT
jgi:hypothetical protein